MRLTPLAPGSAAVAEGLARRGLPPTQAHAAATGLEPVAVVIDDVEPAVREILVRAARGQGIATLSGDQWVFLAGETARLAGLTRPGAAASFPPSLVEPLSDVLRAAFEPPEHWHTARGPILLDTPRVMGILNVTPDSFSDGGRWLAPGDALAHAEHMLAAGADLIDIGAESTRPGRPDPVAPDDEWRRLEPVLTGLVRAFPHVPLSVDTVKVETARRALEAGAWIVNDVSGLRLDPAIADVCASRGAGLLLMHSRGSLSELATYEHAAYADLMGEIAAELATAVTRARAAGMQPASVAVDPGFGFGKRPEQNLQLLDRLGVLRVLGCPIVVGPSRKRFLGVVTGRDAAERDVATAAACVMAYERGARVFRVHAVGPTRDALRVAHAARSA